MIRASIGHLMLAPTIALALGSCAARPPSPNACTAIILDMPHGYWRIHVEADGSGSLAFGALPQTGSFPEGTFEFEGVHAALAREVVSDRSALSSPVGTVQFVRDRGSSEKLWFFNDWELADSFFDVAWKSRLAPRNEIEGQHLETLAGFWQERAPPADPSRAPVSDR